VTLGGGSAASLLGRMTQARSPSATATTTIPIRIKSNSRTPILYA